MSPRCPRWPRLWEEFDEPLRDRPDVRELGALFRKAQGLDRRTDRFEQLAPVVSIRLLAETLEWRLAQGAETKDYPARIIHEADGLGFLVENLLSFNRIDKGRWVPHLSVVRLDGLVATLRRDLEAWARVPVELMADVGERELFADPQLMRLLLANLARNACAYNTRNPVCLRVESLADGRVRFSDNGVGIPEAEWERIFGEFYRLRGQGREVPGSGLGLALCRRILRLHGGDLRVAASSPEGTTFVLTFPERRVMLPDGDGYTLCRTLRQEGVTTPVLMLTARTLEDDVVRGFEAGAQDYLGKPYRLRELLARVGALVRRGGGVPVQVLRFAGYRMDLDRRKVETPEGKTVELTRTEFDLLAFFERERERVLRRDEILDAVWGRDVVVDPHTVDNFVSSLKRKLGWNSASRFALQTVRRGLPHGDRGLVIKAGCRAHS